ncbi:hypothetical protein BATDEDRAFT_23402 [Batrachochytrium dendrobatidis JAM81]|uniref:PUM-HD domain-containing protein n=1 Tax=Batrachochytrium dendrobatidis (strain JAM81 / FGSC 10211) TaxID=684364 RepID=F4NYX3_BATDJ|nr:uncharacterized protein BATDEDRAFT_23402 [Batrachochytrium dendrobatidis JAM81]EGF81784.1 hypothetical protein BATDEDRAFT_23402 [Batrachochytrium dendrobatidis JAM81]|eukprot:XP_006677271.1 hypothetical protein BATDEDRAFT_23402 [Batrachochytrium dendrobatidis JAM81]
MVHLDNRKSIKRQKQPTVQSDHDEDMDEFSDDPQEFELDNVADEYPTEDAEDESTYKDYDEKKEKTSEEMEKNRLARTEQKALTKDRKMQRSHAPMITEAKAIWEELRQKRLKKQERRELMNRMMLLVSGKAKDIIFKHDASRIIQCCLKYGTPTQRDQIAKELSGHYAQLSQSQYGRFIVSKILNYCSQEYRSAVIKEFYGKVRKLIRHKEASLILDEAYSQFANSAQRAALMEEFYGPEYAVFKSLDGSRTLQSLLETEPDKKPTILRHLRQALDSVLQKGSFNLAKTPILHRAIYEYISLADIKVAKDMIELLKDHLVHILHTRDGARIAQYCILHATPKDRKSIIKSFKGFVHAIAQEQYGHTVLLSCFECIDDTVIVSKSLIAELLSPSSSSHAPGTEKTASGIATSAAGAAASISELLRNKYASRVILFILDGRNKKYQPAYIIQELSSMDSIRTQTTKKDDATRQQQLLAASAPLIVQAVAAHANELLRDRTGGQVIVETLYKLHIDVSSVTNAILKLVPENLDPQGIRHSTKTIFSDDNEKDAEQAESADQTMDNLTENNLESTASDQEKSTKLFNAVSKLKSEHDAANLQAQGLDMDSSLFVNRASTWTLKQLVGRFQAGASTRVALVDANADSKSATNSTLAWQPEFASSLFDLVAPHFPTWLEYCAKDPSSRSGTALIFVAMFETAREADKSLTVSKDLIKRMKKSATKVNFNTLKLTIKSAKDAKSTENAKSVPLKKTSKRKIGNSEGSETKTAEPSMFAIETLISYLS